MSVGLNELNSCKAIITCTTNDTTHSPTHRQCACPMSGQLRNSKYRTCAFNILRDHSDTKPLLRNHSYVWTMGIYIWMNCMLICKCQLLKNNKNVSIQWSAFIRLHQNWTCFDCILWKLSWSGDQTSAAAAILVAIKILGNILLQFKWIWLIFDVAEWSKDYSVTISGRWFFCPLILWYTDCELFVKP